MSLRAKLTLIFISVAILQLAIIVGSQYVQTRHALILSHVATLNAIADLKVEHIKSYFDERRKEIAVVQGYYNIQKNLPTIVRFWQDQKSGAYQDAYAQLNEQLRHWVDDRDDVNNILLLDPNGRVVYSADSQVQEKSDGKIFDEDPRAFEIGQQSIYVGDVYKDLTRTQGVDVATAAPLRDLQGRFAGVVVIKFDANNLYALMQDATGLGDTGETVVAKFQYSAVNSDVLESAIVLNPLRSDPDAAFIRTIPVAGKHDTPMQQAIQGKNGSTTTTTTDYRGQDVLAAWRYIPSRDWGLVTKIDAHEALASARQLAIVMGILASIIALVTIVVVVLLARSLTRPMWTLAQIAAAFGAGKLDTQIPASLMTSDKEIGTLASAMATMAKDLKASYAGIEKQVKDKTVELRRALGEVAKFASTADHDSAMYHLLLASIGDGVLVLDNNRAITLMNRVAESIFGYRLDEVKGKRFDAILKFIDGKGRPLPAKFWNSAYEDRKPKVLPKDISVVGKNGISIPIADVVAPIVDPKTQELHGLIITFRDVREERILEEARLGFISTASHQLRTPLTSMRWFAEMLVDGDAGKITKEQKDFVGQIYDSTTRMIALVNLLLQIARVEAGRLKIEPVPVDLMGITKEVAASLKVDSDEKAQKIVIEPSTEKMPMISMDRDVVWQVIQNLLSNAIRYSAHKGIIRVKNIRKGDVIEYAVQDQGIGIPKDQQGKVFEKFFRAYNALKAVPNGSGLGLSLVKALVEGWGGMVWFESVEGKGTTFYFTVPIAGMQPKEGDVKITI